MNAQTTNSYGRFKVSATVPARRCRCKSRRSKKISRTAGVPVEGKGQRTPTGSPLPAGCGGRLRRRNHADRAGATIGRMPATLPPLPATGLAMQCFVYASTRKADTYVWLAARDELSVLPESLLLLLGELRLVLEVQLDEARKLPVEDAEVVLEHLRTQRWHLQLPASETLATISPAPQDEPLRDDRDDRDG